MCLLWLPVLPAGSGHAGLLRCMPVGLPAFQHGTSAHMQECTFAPKTGRPPSRQRLAAGLPVEERLQLGLAGRAQALERARGEREREQLADCTFAPQVGGSHQPGCVLVLSRASWGGPHGVPVSAQLG